MRLSVVGLGKLGSPLAAVLADRGGHEVVGVDVNPALVDLVNRGRAAVDEPGLQDSITRAGARLTATTDVGAAVGVTDATFVIVPTPSDPDGSFSLRYVLDAVDAIGAALRGGSAWHLVVITSTVMPGSTDGPIRDALQRSSGRRVGHDVGLCYSPEFIALGSVIDDMTHPDLILVGESDPVAGEALGSLLQDVCDGQPPVVRMSPVNAELAKISVNTFITTKISFANMLSEVCDGLPGADVEVVTSAIGLDSRIGGKYLRAATGYGGPCFPRDNVAFSRLARSVHVEPDLAEATDRVNRRQLERLGAVVLGELPPGGRVAILGLSYKPGTGVVDEATGLGLAELLADKGCRSAVFDPMALESSRRRLGDRVDYANSVAECVGGADVIVLATPWEEFRALPEALARRGGHTPVVVDCWRLLGGNAPGARLLSLGLADEPGARALEFAARRADESP